MTPHPDEGTLHAFIDGELSAADAGALEAHVAGCGSCTAALAEARGLVAGASRAISALDAAPSTASRPVAAPVNTVPSARPSSRPFVFRVPFARAAALLLLAGGSAVVVNRYTSEDGATPAAKSVAADATLTEERASAAQPVQGTPNTIEAVAANAAPVLTAPTVGRDLSTRGVSGGVGAVSPKQIATPAAPPAVETQPGRVAGSAAAAIPSPAPARMAASEEMALSSPMPASRVTRFRTREGVTLTLTEEPLRTAFAEESAADRRGVARSTAQASAPAANAYRWSSTEQGKSFTLTGSLSIAELEAASKRLSELERVP